MGKWASGKMDSFTRLGRLAVKFQSLIFVTLSESEESRGSEILRFAQDDIVVLVCF